MKISLIVFAILTTLSANAWAADAKPKYESKTIPLSQSNDYLRTHPAPDFWALMPYYTAQMDKTSCSVASTTMIVNGARRDKKLSSEDKLVTQKELVEKVKHPVWHKKSGRYGIMLDDLSLVIPEAMKAYGVDHVSAEITHADSSAETRKKFHDALIENEKSAQDFIVINFDQYAATNDSHAGHVAPVGAFDEKNDRVLILDPDREWYEPYWINEDTLWSGMNTLDVTSGKNRGWAYVKILK